MPSPLRVIDPLGLLPPTRRLLAATTPAAADALARAGLALLDRALSAPATTEAAERVVRSRPVRAAVRAAIEAGLLDVAAEVALRERLLQRALDGAEAERLVAQVLESPLVDASVARVLESDALWVVVEEVAQSPAVAQAIAHQGEGLADQVATEVGQRTRRADARLERVTRRLLHRRPRTDADGGPFAPPQPP